MLQGSSALLYFNSVIATDLCLNHTKHVNMQMLLFLNPSRHMNVKCTKVHVPESH